ncbi:MAG: RagB/SusD family nutrient uptake outer membrane protein [Chlorobi bacterium]|nr:RagB/SusD family nutrient uptake outer membrane protein [Chlorobiota bacterium]
MKKIIYILILVFGFSNCTESFLDESPVAELSPEQILTPENIESVIISAYAVLNGQFDEASNAYNSPASNWSFGDVVSDDAYKGGGGTGDQNQIHLMEIFSTDPTIKDIERKWLCLYEGIRRANLGIRLLNQSEQFDAALKTKRIAELRFLRGHYHFEAKKIYGNICWVDETIDTKEEFYQVSNSDLDNAGQWAKIEEDFMAAYNGLPATQEEVGRPNKMAAKAYLCKTYIFQQKWGEAKAAADEVIASGNYSLEPNFRDIFLAENDNGQEIIFAVQQSINDGSPRNYNGSIGDRLMPPGGPYPGYGFFRPTQNLVNAYKTDENGLPQFDNIDVTEADFLDPRIDHTLARPGIPYLDLGVYDWTPREASVYGPYSPKKRMLSKNSPYILGTWPYVTALNYYIIRYADLLLWKAEAEIETGNLEKGREYINLVRQRAKNSEYVKTVDGSADAANYLINTYAQPFAGKAEALEALRMERRLELAHEGHRFFDIVRWGIAAQVMNSYFDVEKTKRSHLVNARFVAGKHEYQPIPQSQIDLSQGNMKQNPNYND